MRTFPDRNFFRRKHLPKRYLEPLDQVALFDPPPTLPTHPDECVQVLLELLRPESREAIAAVAALTAKPDLPMLRRVCRRLGTRIEPVAAAFGLVRQRRRWTHAEDRPIHLPTGDVELLAAFVLYQACGGQAEISAVG